MLDEVGQQAETLPISTATLSKAFCEPESHHLRATIVRREPSGTASTFPSEIVTCRFPDGSDQRVYCKYAFGNSHNQHLLDSRGHRGGLAYEAQVYRHVLRPLSVSVPRMIGEYAEAASGDRVLALEYLDGSESVNLVWESTGIARAAQWIGQFHRLVAGKVLCSQFAFLNRYDAEYYAGWARRTSLYADHLHHAFPWLAAICEYFEDALAPLLAAPPVVIHGEYYPANILYRNGIVHPVDWESAALATGEVDLATLIDGWSRDVVSTCVDEYQRARWQGNPPADFERTLATAQLYLCFRWLGDRASWTTSKRFLRWFDQLHASGERLGIF